MTTTSYWLADAREPVPLGSPSVPPDADVKVDVAVIGGGVTYSCAPTLAERGVRA